MLDTIKRQDNPTKSAIFGMRVDDFMRPRADALAIRADTPCGDMIAHMAAAKASCAVAVDPAGRPVGIITEQDIARRLTFRLPPETPVEAIMTAPVMTIESRDYLYHAIAWMRRSGLRHMPVVDRQGRLNGMLYLHDALAVATERLVRQIDLITHEGTIDGLRQVRAAQIELAEELFEENLPSPEIQQVITQINNDMYRRIGEATIAKMREEGWGEPPAQHCTIVMGSGGRGENYLFPDQDNGFIIEPYPDAEHARVDAWFLEMAERLCRDLNEIGIPYCNGYCMAVNPLWRKTLPQWIEQITLWSRKSNFVAVRLADIFFDFQPASGHRDLATELRSAVTGVVRHNHMFLRQMFQDQADHNVGLGFFGGFVTETEKKEYRGQMNLKYTGTLPLVEGIRLLALREGIEETSTLDRIRALHESGVLDVAEHEDLTSAFHLITDILLRKQIADYKADRRITYYVSPKSLNRRDRLMLLDSLKAIDSFRKRVHLEFTAQIF